MDLDSLASMLAGCRRCPLGKTREHQVVFGEGACELGVMFVGEGPGHEEDVSGRPFVGLAGQLLTKILESASIPREKVYITNVVKCRPPGNRTPEDAEIRTCGAFLLQQIELLQPKIIVALGNVAKSFFLGKDVPGITRCRGNYYAWRGLQVTPMYHPSYLLRNASREVGGPKWQTWQDIRELKGRIDLIASGSELPGSTPAGPQKLPSEEAGPSTKPADKQTKLF